MAKKQTLDFTIHRYFGVNFNQLIWDFLAKEKLTIEEGYELIDLAHSSNMHWRFAGTQVNLQRGAYMIARVYLAVGSADAAIIYANKCQEFTDKFPEEMKDFDFAYAAEIMWKCNLAEGNTTEAETWKNKTRKLGDEIKNAEDKKYFDKDYNTAYKRIME